MGIQQNDPGAKALVFSTVNHMIITCPICIYTFLSLPPSLFSGRRSLIWLVVPWARITSISESWYQITNDFRQTSRNSRRAKKWMFSFSHSIPVPRVWISLRQPTCCSLSLCWMSVLSSRLSAECTGWDKQGRMHNHQFAYNYFGPPPPKNINQHSKLILAPSNFAKFVHSICCIYTCNVILFLNYFTTGPLLSIGSTLRTQLRRSFTTSLSASQREQSF